jgi:hypothetical protein
LLVWHTSGQQGLVLRSAAGEDASAEGAGREGTLAVAMEGGEAVSAAPGDVLVTCDGCGLGPLVVRKKWGGGLQLLRFTWTGGFKGLDQRECGQWAATASCRSDGESSMCSVVLAFAVSADHTSPAFLLAAARFACGYEDGECCMCITRHTSHVTRHTSHLTRHVGSIILLQLDGTREALSLKAHERDSCCITGQPCFCCSSCSSCSSCSLFTTAL